MQKLAASILLAILPLASLHALWQGPLLLFRRAPGETPGPATKALEESFSRLPELPPPGATATVAKTEPKGAPDPNQASLVIPESTTQKNPDDLSNLFQNIPSTPTTPAAPVVTLPADSPEVPVSPAPKK